MELITKLKQRLCDHNYGEVRITDTTLTCIKCKLEVELLEEEVDMAPRSFYGKHWDLVSRYIISSYMGISKQLRLLYTLRARKIEAEKLAKLLRTNRSIR